MILKVPFSILLLLESNFHETFCVAGWPHNIGVVTIAPIFIYTLSFMLSVIVLAVNFNRKVLISNSGLHIMTAMKSIPRECS